MATFPIVIPPLRDRAEDFGSLAEHFAARAFKRFGLMPVEVVQSEVEPLDTVIRRHIENALVICQGRVDGPFGAARRLELKPSTLRSKMRKLGIDSRLFR